MAKTVLGIPVEEFDFTTYNPSMLPPHAGKTYELATNPGVLFEDPFDVLNLKFFDPQEVHGFHLSLEHKAHNQANKDIGSAKKIIAVIGTGGTIAMVKENGELVPRLDSEQLLKTLPGPSQDRYEVVSIQLAKMIDSSVMPPDVIADIALLTSVVWAKMSENLKKHFAGFLITHGTDTMEYSSAL
ncbi:asparaginase, partial [Candidatus Saccharibacteria bacterium]|nr:asparaginase [Candidatus Saccharibacteria bacterium]